MFMLLQWPKFDFCSPSDSDLILFDGKVNNPNLIFSFQTQTTWWPLNQSHIQPICMQLL